MYRYARFSDSYSLSNVQTDIADTIDRTFHLTYHSPFTSTLLQPFDVQIRDETFVIGSQTWNSAPILAQRLATHPLHFFGSLALPCVELPPTPPQSRPGTPSLPDSTRKLSTVR